MIKRLQNTFDDREMASAWARFNANFDAIGRRFRDVGLDPEDYYAVLFDGLASERRWYEDKLREQAVKHQTRRELRTGRALLKRVGPIITFMKTRQDSFGHLGEALETRLTAYCEELTKRSTAQKAGVIPPHRPSDQWLNDVVVFLARQMRQHGVSLRRTIREILFVLQTLGHGDLASADKIHHIIRTARKTDPQLSKAP